MDTDQPEEGQITLQAGRDERACSRILVLAPVSRKRVKSAESETDDARLRALADDPRSAKSSVRLSRFPILARSRPNSETPTAPARKEDATRSVSIVSASCVLDALELPEKLREIATKAKRGAEFAMEASGEVHPKRRWQCVRGGRIPQVREGTVRRSIRAAPQCVGGKTAREMSPGPESGVDDSVPGDKRAPDMFDGGARQVRGSGSISDPAPQGIEPAGTHMFEDIAGPFKGQEGTQCLIKRGMRGRAIVKKSTQIGDSNVRHRGSRQFLDSAH